jgi:hypothetical protein
VVAPVTLETADDFVAGFGEARLVCRLCLGTKGPIDVAELEVPAGIAGPVGLRYPAPPRGPGVEIYNWISLAWRPAPTATTEVSLEPGELHGGLVRVRAGDFDDEEVRLAVLK